MSNINDRHREPQAGHMYIWNFSCRPVEMIVNSLYEIGKVSHAFVL